MFKTVSPVRWLVVCVALAAWALVPSTSAFKTTTPDFTTTTLTGFGFAWDVVIDDVNGDGHADLIGALVMPSENSVGVALGDGAGGFSAMQRYFSGPRPSSVAVADMNGDGFKDAILANQNGDNPGGNVAVLFGDGTGAFGPPTVTVNAQFAKALKIGDFNGDGAPDVAVIDFNAWVQLFINNNDNTGQMTARPAQAVPGGQPVRLAVGDIDGDGDQDMAVVSAFADPNTGGTDALALYMGDGTGELSAPVMRSFPSGFNVRDVAVRNIDADLELEIVASSGGGVGGDGGAGVWVFDNGVGGVATSPVRYAAPVGAHGLALGDVNDDGHVDVLLALKDTANLVYYLGNGDGTFAPFAGGAYPGISGQPQYVAVGEFDAAGQSSLDVVIARVAQDPIYLHNRPNLPPAANAGADQVVTASVATGAFVTLDGSASTDPESTALTFEWRDAANTVVGNAAVSGVTVPLGVHVYTLHVTDAGGASGSGTVTITVLAGTTTSIACSTPVTYTGAAITPCTATVLGVDGFSLGGAPSYTDNIAVGTATASYTFSGDATHASSFGSTTFSISAKPVTATLTAIDKIYDGTATEPDANMSCTVTGTVPGDVVTCAASNGVFSGANAGSSAVSATATLGGAHAGNYTLGAVGTSLQSTTLTATSGGSVASTTADLVYGQLGSFTVRLQNNGGISANSMNQPYRVAIDSTGGLYVAEEQNHRVVYFPAGSTTATRVYGQSGSFTSATSNNGGLSANSLSYARGVAVDANDNLYVVDGGNHRVLFYPAGTTTATRVYGQGGVFTTGTINKGGVSADSLNDPTIAIADASGNVYIADQNNNRVLFYAGTSTTATRVYGQNGNFATTGTGVSATTFNQPGNLVVDAAGNLYVSDLTNNRVLFFLNGSTTATRVYGQNGNFGTNSAGTSATALRFPRAAAIDSNNNLYVADQQNHRVLFFPAGTTTATRVYGQGGSFTSGTSNNGGVSANSLNNPLGGAISADGKLYIADLSNNRVLRFSTIGSGRITTASSTTTISCPASAPFTGSAVTPCSATVTGAGGFSQPVSVNYSNNINSGTATASANFAGDVNHTASSASTTFAITRTPVTATLTALAKQYDRTTTEPNGNMSCTLSGVAPADVANVTCAASGGVFDSANAGARTVTATVTLGGTAAGGYTLGAAGTAVTSTSATAASSILTSPVSASLTAANKAYDGTATEPNALMSCALGGVFVGDTVTCTATNGAFSAASVGSGGVTATVTIGGAAAGNYTLGAVGTTQTSATVGVSPSTAAEAVYGQLSFTGGAPNAGGLATGFNSPARPATDSLGGLYVPESFNNRVMYFPAGSTTATRVYGQLGSFTTNVANKGGISADSLSFPRAVWADANGVYIADGSNGRVLFYPGTSTTATRVYGQGGNFTTGLGNGVGLNADSIAEAMAITTDASGNVYIADRGNHRVLFYTGTSTTASRVYGQFGSFTGYFGGGLNANTLTYPAGLALDSGGNLYIADLIDNRVLFYPAGTTTATRVYGQNGSFTTNAGGTSATTMRGPSGIAIDAADNLYVPENQNNRVLVFPAGSTVPTRVYGQGGSFVTSASLPIGASSLSNPLGVAISPDGKLFVADTSVNRVLRYSTQAGGKIITAPVTVALTAADKTYDATTAAADASLSCVVNGLVPADAANVSCTATAGSFSVADSGAQTVTATVTISGTAGGNYTLGAAGTAVMSATATASATITPAASTTTVTCAPTATYTGSAIEVCTATVTGVGGLNEPVGVTYTSNVNAGTATATANFVGDANHGASSATGTFEITPAASTTIVNCTPTVTYTGSAIDACSATATGVGGLNASVPVTYTNNVSVGTATATASFVGDANHLGSTGSATFDITRAPVTATLVASGKQYDRNTAASNSSLSCLVSGVAPADAANVTCAASGGVFDSSNVGARIVTATVSISGAAAGNYALSPSTATAPSVITTRPVTATLTAADKTYDGTATEPDAAMSCAVTGVLPGDIVTCTPTNGAFNGTAAGSSAVTATATLGGAAAGNYTLGAAGTTVNSATIGVAISTTAQAVYGQLGSFTSAAQNNGGLVSGMMNPRSVATDSQGGLYVVESQNHRVTYFAAGSTTSSRVYGQLGSLTTAVPNKNGISADSLNFPRAVWVDANDDVYIADGNNSRVLFYAGTSTTATRVYGQGGNFASGVGNGMGLNADSLAEPLAVTTDANGVYIADRANRRVLFYAGTSTTATRVYGQGGSFTSVGFGGPNADSLTYPVGLATDSTGGLYVADVLEHRVLFYPAGSTTSSRVYGQMSFTSTAPGTSATTLAGPVGLAVDPSDNLYVADSQNNRVLVFAAGGTTATRVYGQGGSFTSAGFSGVTANSLVLPQGIAVSGGTLFIADSQFSRVLRYSTEVLGKITTAPLTATLTAAGKVFDGTTDAPDATLGCTITGLVAGDEGNVTCTATSGAFGSANAGAQTVTATVMLAGSAAANYTLGAAGTTVNSSTATAPATIAAAPSTTVVTCPTSVPATGSAQTPCAAVVTGAGGLNEVLSVTYTNNTTPGTATATASFAGDANHSSSSDAKTFDIIATAPLMVGTPADLTVEATLPTGQPVAYTPPTATDAQTSAAVPVTCAPLSGTIFPFGATTVTCSATDVRGNTATSSFIVTVVDTLAPVFNNPPADRTVDATGPNGAIETFRAPRARDDADGGIVSTCAPASGSQFPIGSTTVTCTATDAHGNTASVTFRVIVADTTAPVITDLPGNLRIEATSAAGAPVTYATPTATDAVDGAVAVVCAPASGATFPLGNTTVRCTAADAAGNSRTRSFAVTVRDTTAPTILGAADQTIEATSFNPVRVFFTPTAVDLVDGPVALTCSPRLPPQGILLSFGQSVVVRCSALDRSGNRSNTTTTLMLTDTTAPRFVLTDMVVEATSPRGATVRLPVPFVDLLDSNPSMSCQGPQGSIPIGTTTITCRATDFSGNRATGSITITVRDTTGPAWSSLPSSSPVAATSAAGRSVSFAPVAIDVVTGPATAVCAPASGSVFPIGATTVTCTASDATGHASSTSFVVTVADTAPVVTVPASMVIEANRTTGALVVFTASALDAVDGARSVACVPASGSVFPFGATNVVCRSTDSAGNQASNGFTVRVADTIAPTISVPEVTPNMRVFRGQQVPITINCADSGSGVATCRPISGAHLVGTTWYLDTGIFDLGSLSLIARDVAGNATRLTINYRFR